MLYTLVAQYVNIETLNAECDPFFFVNVYFPFKVLFKFFLKKFYGHIVGKFQLSYFLGFSYMQHSYIF